MRKSIGYGVYGEDVFAPDFIVCKSEGGTANCPSEYVKEFSGLGDLLSNKAVLVGVAAAVAGAIFWWKKTH